MFFLDATTTQALTICGGVGAVAGLVGGFFSSTRSLVGTMLMGVIGGIAAAAILRIANAPPVYGVGDSYSVVWAAAGGLVLAFVTGRSQTIG
ncbi:MAG: hypothetical protein ACE5F5_05290 [Acidimicrobiia bacterium]